MSARFERAARVGDWIQTALGGQYFPLDPRAPEYLRVERLNTEAIAQRFGLPSHFDEAPEIKLADNVLLMTEARDLMKKPPVAWVETTPLLPGIIHPRAPHEAHRAFLRRFYQLKPNADAADAAFSAEVSFHFTRGAH